MACKTLTPQSIVGGALALLGRPPALMSRLGDLYDILGTTVESYRNLIRVHDGNFLLKKQVIELPAGSTEVSFTENSWGRPVLCDIDPDSIPTGVTLPKREIDILNIQDLDQYRAGLPGVMGQNINLLPSQAWVVAAAVAWNREDDEDGNSVIKLYFEFGGYQPQQAVTYRFFYEPGGVAEVLESERADILPEFVGLLQHDFALQILPHSEIAEPTYTRLEKRLDTYVLRNRPTMEQFLQQGHMEQSGRFEGYNRNRYGARINHHW